MNLISGIDKADKGEITVAGNRIPEMNKSDMALFRRKNLGLVFQDFNLGLTEKVHFFKQTLFPASQNSNSATAKFYTKEAGASYPGSLPEIEAQSHIHW